MKKLSVFSTRRTTVLCIATFFLGIITPVAGQSKSSRPVDVSAGISFNPGLAILHKEYEVGPALGFTFPVWKNWNAGALVQFRRVWHLTPDRRYGYDQNITVPRNNEWVYALQLGYTSAPRTWIHNVFLHPGIRADIYEERLNNPSWGIDERYKLKESNFFLAVSYGVRRKTGKNQYLGARWLLPFDRTPQDDINRHSLELGWHYRIGGNK